MVKSTHIAFPQDGVELHISAQDALAHGIKPGDPAVVEVTVRAHTVDEWVAEATAAEITLQAEGPGPVAAADPVTAAAQPVGSGAVEEPARIRWRSAGVA
jgi:hypothetical protein